MASRYDVSLSPYLTENIVSTRSRIHGNWGVTHSLNYFLASGRLGLYEVDSVCKCAMKEILGFRQKNVNH